MPLPQSLFASRRRASRSSRSSLTSLALAASLLLPALSHASAPGDSLRQLAANAGVTRSVALSDLGITDAADGRRVRFDVGFDDASTSTRERQFLWNGVDGNANNRDKWGMATLVTQVAPPEPEPAAPTVTQQPADTLAFAGQSTTLTAAADGWPVPTGGRYVKLCFSPLARADGEGGHPDRTYRLPLTAEDYVAYVEGITGLGATCDDALMDLFRFTPGWLFDATNAMRTMSPEAWTLLLSNEFALACQLWPRLRLIVEDSPFRHGLVHGFMIIAELERAHLIMRHLARARAIIERVCADLGESFTEISIDDDPALRARYGEEIPVTLVDGRQHDFWRVDEARLRTALSCSRPSS